MLYNELKTSLFQPYAITGLLGVFFTILYFKSRYKKNQKLSTIRNAVAADRQQMIEDILDETAVHFDTSLLTPEQKYEMLVTILKTKSRNLFIIALVFLLTYGGLLTASQRHTEEANTHNQQSFDTPAISSPDK